MKTRCKGAKEATSWATSPDLIPMGEPPTPPPADPLSGLTRSLKRSLLSISLKAPPLLIPATPPAPRVPEEGPFSLGFQAKDAICFLTSWLLTSAEHGRRISTLVWTILVERLFLRSPVSLRERQKQCYLFHLCLLMALQSMPVKRMLRGKKVCPSRGRVSLHRPEWSGTHDLPVTDSQVLGIRVLATSGENKGPFKFELWKL